MKKWYQQKTTWAGLSLLITGIGSLVTGEGIGAASSPLIESIGLIASGFGLVALRAAIERLMKAISAGTTPPEAKQ